MEWQKEKLGKICRIELGKTPSRSNKKLWDEAKEGKNVWLSIADLPHSLKPIISDSKEYISEEGRNICKLVPKGTLILSFKLSIGRLAFTGRDLYTNEAIAALYIGDSALLLQDYLYWYLKFFDWDNAVGNDVKVKGKTLNKAKLKEIDVFFPPIEEQKRIVTILDQVFADIEKARATVETNLKNARELFDSYLQQVFNRGDDERVKLGDEIELLTGFAFKSKEYVTHEKSIPLIRGDNIVQGQLRWDGVKLWPTERLVEFEKYELAANDIVLAMDRTWVKAGIKVAKIANEDLPALLVQRVARLRCKSSLDPDFLYYLIRSKFFENYVLSIQTGLGVPHISGKQIQSFIFNKPSYDEQLQLIKKMNALSFEVQSLEAVYRCKLNSLEELKKSILQKAFSGELTKSKGIAA